MYSFSFALSLSLLSLCSSLSVPASPAADSPFVAKAAAGGSEWGDADAGFPAPLLSSRVDPQI